MQIICPLCVATRRTLLPWHWGETLYYICDCGGQLISFWELKEPLPKRTLLAKFLSVTGKRYAEDIAAHIKGFPTYFHWELFQLFKDPKWGSHDLLQPTSTQNTYVTPQVGPNYWMKLNNRFHSCSNGLVGLCQFKWKLWQCRDSHNETSSMKGHSNILSSSSTCSLNVQSHNSIILCSKKHERFKMILWCSVP